MNITLEEADKAIQRVCLICLFWGKRGDNYSNEKEYLKLSVTL